MSTRRASWIAVATFAAAALALVALPGHARAASGAVDEATAWPASLCGIASPQTSSTLVQSLDGAVHGCLRIPPTTRSTLGVALQSWVDQHAESWPVPTTGISTNLNPDGAFRLRVDATTVRPGQHVTLRLVYAHRHPADLSQSLDVCWDGCQSGIVETAMAHAISRSVVRATLVVPDAPWFAWSAGRVAVHPLASGADTVGVECLVASSGCALAPADAAVVVHLVAPLSTPCDATHACATLSLRAAVLQVGDVLVVSGRAPLEQLIGQPWGYSLTTTAAPKTHAPWLTLQGAASATEQVATLAPRTVRLRAPATWASQGRLHAVSATWSGTAAATPLDARGDVAWCDPGAIELTGPNGLVARLATATMAKALTGSGLSLVGVHVAPTCATALVDTANPRHAVAVLGTGVHGVIPPVVLVGLETSNGGATWHLIPTPHGAQPSWFGGFVTRGDRVEALFTPSPTVASGAVIAVEQTTLADLAWTTGTLTCPSTGPCTTFGPVVTGNCAMNPAFQQLLVGHVAAGVAAWGTTTWVSAVDGCASQELAVTAAHQLALLDPASSYPLLVSDDGGRTWHDVALPALSGLSAAPTTYGADLALAPDGSVLAQLRSPSTGAWSLWRLTPRATRWCAVRASLPRPLGAMSPIRVAGEDLVWTATAPSSTSARNVRLPLARLTCEAA